MTTRKTAKVIKEFKTTWHGIELTVPKGAIVSNQTANDFDDNYRFWVDYPDHIDRNTLVAHDLMFYGLNVPPDYCEPYEKDPDDRSFDLNNAKRRTLKLVEQITNKQTVYRFVDRAIESGAVDPKELEDNYRLPQIMACIIGKELQIAYAPVSEYDTWFMENIHTEI